MINNKYGWEMLRAQERASAEAYAEDMDNWSVLRESPNTGDVSLRPAKESTRGAKMSNIGQMTPICYLMGLGKGLQRPALEGSLRKRQETPIGDRVHKVKWEIPVKAAAA